MTVLILTLIKHANIAKTRMNHEYDFTTVRRYDWAFHRFTASPIPRLHDLLKIPDIDLFGEMLFVAFSTGFAHLFHLFGVVDGKGEGFSKGFGVTRFEQDTGFVVHHDLG